MHDTVENTVPLATVPSGARILLVDDNDLIREPLCIALTSSGFDVVTAAVVAEALQLIATQTFDVLLNDLHMPHADDGLILVRAMKHSNPRAVTIVVSGYPELKEAATAIVLHADGIDVNPMAVKSLLKTINDRLPQSAVLSRSITSVADILQEETQSTIDDWLLRVELEPFSRVVPLESGLRCAHLLHLFHDLVSRLRYPLPLGTHAHVSVAAAQHGLSRSRQGYTGAMLVEESRMLQVSIFQTLQNNIHRVDFSLLLVSVMAIADEVDSQLAQAMASFASETRTSFPARYVPSGGLMIKSDFS